MVRAENTSTRQLWRKERLRVKLIAYYCCSSILYLSSLKKIIWKIKNISFVTNNRNFSDAKQISNAVEDMLNSQVPLHKKIYNKYGDVYFIILILIYDNVIYRNALNFCTNFKSENNLLIILNKNSKKFFWYEKNCLKRTNLTVVFISRSDNFIVIYIFLII